MTNEKKFPKTINQWEFDYGFFTDFPRIIVTWDFSHSSFKSRRYPNLETTCHNRLNFFLWTKLFENLLLARYIMSVVAPLILIKTREKYLSRNSLFRLETCNVTKTELFYRHSRIIPISHEYLKNVDFSDLWSKFLQQFSKNSKFSRVSPKSYFRN